MSKHNNNYEKTERYLREENGSKKVGDSRYNEKETERSTVENGTFDKKCSDKNCRCNGGSNKYCK